MPNLLDCLNQWLADTQDFLSWVECEAIRRKSNLPDTADQNLRTFRLWSDLNAANKKFLESTENLRAELAACGFDSGDVLLALSHHHAGTLPSEWGAIRARIWTLRDKIKADPQGAMADPGTADDPYIPAKACLDDRIKSHKQLLKVLRENPEIRSQHPTPQRLKVHAADLLRWKQKQADAKWNADDTDALMEAIESQKDNPKQKRTNSTAGLTALAKKITAKTH